MRKLTQRFSLQKMFVISLLLLLPYLVSASHFRYGNISWTNTSGNTVVFKIQQAWRYSYPWPTVPVLGSTINVSASGTATFNFGDGTTTNIILTVTAVNTAEDWFFGEATITKTYSSAGPRIAFWQSDARISTLQNNADGDYRVQTRVNVGAGNSSPVSNISPIVNLAAGNPAASFVIPALDPDGSPLTFRLATPFEASGGIYTQPAGIFVNPSTGQVNFSTLGKAIGNLYTTQIITSDGPAEVAIDFVIRIVPPGNAPTYNYATTPPNASVMQVVAGTPLNFTVEATDIDPQQVRLSAVGVPVGASFSPALPALGNPVSSDFSWTPTPSQVGNFIVVFQAVDEVGLTRVTSVTIRVILCNLSLSQSTTNVSCFGESTGAVDLTVTGGVAPLTYLWSNGATTEDINELSAGNYAVKVTDANNCVREIGAIVSEPVTPLAAQSGIGEAILCNGGTGSIVINGTGGTAPFFYTIGSTSNVSGIFSELSAGTHAFTVTDANGCTVNGSITLTEPSPVECTISVTPDITIPGHAANTIYLGFGPQNVTLTGSGAGGTGGYIYDWGSAGTGASVTVSPLVTTVYTLIVLDANGCLSNCTVTINVIDVRCGKKNDKIQLCHKPGGNEHNNCISEQAVQAHLDHGDHLGNCGSLAITNPLQKAFAEEGKIFAGIKAFPNPAKQYLDVQWKAGKEDRVTVRISDLQGRIIFQQQFSGLLPQQMNIKRLPLQNVSKGIYLLQVIGKKEIQKIKFSIQ